MTKRRKKQEQQRYLSNDLIFQEILTRLPVNSVLRFKSVSKQWYSTLSSSDFVIAHLIKSPFSHHSAPVNTLFIMDKKNHCYLFSYNDDHQISSNFKDNLVKLDDFDGLKDYLNLTGCGNGLICLTEYFSDKYFILWNPATRKLHKYQSDGYLDRFDALIRPHQPSVSSVDDYKYVRILTEYWGCPKFNIVHIFSLRENKWRKIDFGHDPLVIFKHAVLVGEKLYWAAYRSETGDLIVSFDLGLEKFDVIKIKIDWEKGDFLGVMSGCLSKYNYIGDKLMHILEPPDIVKSIDLPKGLKLDLASEMIGFTKTDKFFVTGSFSDTVDLNNRMLGVVDTRTKPVQYTSLLKFNEWIKIVRYFPSLVSPFSIVATEKPSEA